MAARLGFIHATVDKTLIQKGRQVVTTGMRFRSVDNQTASVECYKHDSQGHMILATLLVLIRVQDLENIHLHYQHI